MKPKMKIWQGKIRVFALALNLDIGTLMISFERCLY